jgi:hypothetical protein
LKTSVSVTPIAGELSTSGQYTPTNMTFTKTISDDSDTVLLSVEISAREALEYSTEEMLAEYISDAKNLFKQQIDLIFDRIGSGSTTVSPSVGTVLGLSIARSVDAYMTIRGPINDD